MRMKAITFKKNLQILDLDKPVPQENEALIRISKAGICNTDLEITKGYMDYEGIPGHEFVGVVEEAPVTSIIGKRVAGEINLGCGVCSFCLRGLSRHCLNRTVLGIAGKSGVFAEYVTLPVQNCHLLPDAISDDAAVFIEPLAAAFEILEQVHIKPLDKVLVLGDGKLGQLIAPVLSLAGCDVTVYGKHPFKLEKLKKYAVETITHLDTHQFYDVVVEATGSTTGISLALSQLKSRGTLVLKTTTKENPNIPFSEIVVREITLIGSRCGPFEPAIRALASGRIHVSDLITHRFSLDEGLKAFSAAVRKDAIKVILDVADI